MSSINSIGSNSSMAMMHGMRRPDPAKMADQLFDKLDTSGQGYLQKADFESAFSSISSSSSSTDVDSLFTQLDGDSDGKVTKQEFSTALSQLSEQLDQQFQSRRMQEAMPSGEMGGMGGPGGMGGMPPPPPPANDEGFSKDELSSQLEEIGSTDSKRASLISNIVENFEAADTDGDGKVSFQEAMAFDQASKTSGSSDSSASATASTEDSEARVMMQIMKLMQAYMSDDQAAKPSLSVTA